MHPSDLPRLEISAVNADCGIGRFDPSPWMGEGWIGYLYVGEGRFIRGRFRDIDVSRRTCSFYPDDRMQVAGLRANLSCPYLDGYWGERAELKSVNAKRPRRQRRYRHARTVTLAMPATCARCSSTTTERIARTASSINGRDEWWCVELSATLTSHQSPGGQTY